MTINTYNCPSCGSPQVKIMDNMSYTECEYCHTKFCVEQRDGEVFLRRLDQVMRQVVQDTSFSAAIDRLTYIDQDITEAQQLLDQREQAKSQQERKIAEWVKKRQDREFYLLLINAVLIFFAFLLWYQVIFKLEGQAWGVGAIIAMGLSFLIILLFIAYFIAHKSLPVERANLRTKVDDAQTEVDKAQLQLNELTIEKELCLYRKKNYHVRAAPTN